MEITFYKIEGPIFPTLGTPESAAYDLYCSQDIEIPSHSLGLIHTGLVVEYEEGWAALICLRSSTPKKYGLLMPHGVGLIDRDYCGPDDEVLISVYNFTDTETVVRRGDSVAQLLFVRSATPNIVKRSPTKKNRGGFGSTNL